MDYENVCFAVILDRFDILSSQVRSSYTCLYDDSEQLSFYVKQKVVSSHRYGYWKQLGKCFDKITKH